MSDQPTTRRHPNIINVREAKELAMSKGSRFAFSGRILGEATGASGIGASHYEVPPGRTAFPSHYHCANEESMYVLEGEGSLRIGEATIAVGAGDYVTFPVGPAHAHQITNTGTGPLRYLALSTKHNVDVVGYPDSKKFSAGASAPGSKFGDPGWVRMRVRPEAMLDYYDGETID